MDRELNIICTACEQPIDDHEGNIWIPNGELHQQREAIDQWEGRAATAGLQAGPNPEKAHWRAHHHACDDAEVVAAYSIQSERLRSWADLVSWTAQLMGKTWITYTDWAVNLASAAEFEDGFLLPVAEPELNA